MSNDSQQSPAMVPRGVLVLAGLLTIVIAAAFPGVGPSDSNGAQPTQRANSLRAGESRDETDRRTDVSDRENPRDDRHAIVPFTLSGDAVTRLSPGQESDLRLTIRNPNRFALRLETIRIAFIGRPSCDGPSNFAVSRAFVGPYTVPPGETRLPSRVAPKIRMRDLPRSQDGCQSILLTLRYSATASRA